MDSYYPNFESYCVIDSSDEDEGCNSKPSTSKQNVVSEKISVRAVNIAIDKYLKKNKEAIEKQIVLCDEFLKKKFETVVQDADSIDEYIYSLEEEMNEVRNLFYEPFTPIFTDLDPLDITDFEECVTIISDTKIITDKEVIIDKEVITDNEIITDIEVITDKEEITNVEEITSIEDKTDNENIIDKEDKEDVIAIKRTVCSIPPDLPKIGVSQYPPFREGQILLAKKFTLIEPWYRCKVKSVINEDYIHVTFINHDKLVTDKLVTKKEVAYITQNHVQFEVGTRIIAKYTEPGSKVMDHFYAGVIGEPPKLINKFR